jgi:hypothetical protein
LNGRNPTRTDSDSLSWTEWAKIRQVIEAATAYWNAYRHPFI